MTVPAKEESKEDAVSSGLVRVIPVEEFDFVNVDNNTSLSVLVASRIEVGDVRDGDLIARLHDVSWPTSGSGASLAVEVLQDGHTEQDPATPLLGETLATATFQQSYHTTASVIVKSLSGALGQYVAVQLTAHQANSDSPGVFKITLSVDLMLKG